MKLILAAIVSLSTAHASENLKSAHQLFSQGQYFRAARYAFSAAEDAGAEQPEAYGLIAASLTRANLPNAASYFFIRTLQTGDRAAIRKVLLHTQDLMMVVGADYLKHYLIQYTKYEDYNELNRSAYLFALGKAAVLKGDNSGAIGYLRAVSSASSIYPYALELKGTAEAIANQTQSAIQSFRACAEVASRKGGQVSDDLKNRCVASEARTLYQINRFDEAERVYDQIPKSSLIWTDILFEQAWNAFAKTEYNRTLGKLVTYKSPALKFVFNSEVDVLRAQAYLALCLYADANEVVNEFNRKYAKLGEDVKRYVEGNSRSLESFFYEGKKSLDSSLYQANDFHRMMNRFVRSAYFQKLVSTERGVRSELAAVRRFSAMSGGDSEGGFPGFLKLELGWRGRMAKLIGGAFIKNSLIDYHSVLINDFEKMSFIKLEMLGRAKEKLSSTKPVVEGRGRGSKEPIRRGDQYKWSFNGEFWTDELGDYVFALESECR